MARGGRINILVVDDQSGKSYQWTISALRLRILLSAAGVLCILALSAIVLAGLVIEQNNRLDELTAENMRLTADSCPARLWQQLWHRFVRALRQRPASPARSPRKRGRRSPAQEPSGAAL